MSKQIDSHRVDKAITGYLGAAVPEFTPVARTAIPEVEVGAENYSGIAYTYPLKAMHGDGGKVGTAAMKRGPSDPFPELFTDVEPTKTTFQCEIHGGAPRSLSDREAERWQFDVGLIEEKAMMLNRSLDLDHELVGMRDTIFNTGNWFNAAVAALTGGAGVAWSTLNTSNPTKDGLAVGQIIRAASGVAPDYGCITNDVLNVLRYHPQTIGVYAASAVGLASVQDLAVPDDQVLAIWAKRWRLRLGLYVVDEMYNASNMGQDASLTEIGTGKLWMGCKRGAMGGIAAAGGVAIRGAGPVSVVRLVETQKRGYSWREDNPPATKIAADESYCYLTPTDMKGTAYLVTGLV